MDPECERHVWERHELASIRGVISKPWVIKVKLEITRKASCVNASRIVPAPHTCPGPVQWCPGQEEGRGREGYLCTDKGGGRGGEWDVPCPGLVYPLAPPPPGQTHTFENMTFLHPSDVGRSKPVSPKNLMGLKKKS